MAGRALTGIHIWGSGGKGSKPAILFHGTVHAREWISSMTVEYMAWQLLTKYSTDATVKSLVDKFDFYIMVSFALSVSLVKCQLTLSSADCKS